MRLIDKLRAAGHDVPEMPVVVVDNVAEYMVTLNDNRVHRTDELPCCKPPFDLMWIEARETSSWKPGGFNSFGYSVERRDDAMDVIAAEKLKGATQLYVFSLYADSPRGLYRVQKGDCALGLKDDGSVAVCLNNVSSDEEEKTFWWLHHCACLGLAFMHCKNIVAKDVVVSAAARQTKAGKKRIRSYSVLQIDPMRDVLRREGKVGANGLAKALHICRGHFKRYDKPLFGKTFTGTVWVPSHARGSADKGIVAKSYAVETPPIPVGRA